MSRVVRLLLLFVIVKKLQKHFEKFAMFYFEKVNIIADKITLNQFTKLKNGNFGLNDAFSLIHFPSLVKIFLKQF